MNEDQDTTWTPDIVIYHDHCADGFGAAWACWLRWRDRPEYIAASYGSPPPDVVGKNVLIVDFSYKRDVLREMGKQAHSIVVLDHHKTAQADLADWAIEDVAGDFWAGDDVMKSVRHNDDYIGQPIAALFDMNRSGARMAWDFCHENDPPNLIQLIEDRDLWRFQYDETKPFSLWLRSEPFNFERWELIAQELADGRDGDRIMTEAHAMQRFFDAKVDEIASFAKRRRVGDHEPIVVNCPPMFASEVGHALLDKHPNAPFAATYFDAPNVRMWSLRSRDDREDVSAVASQFGGGGHRNAAGFSQPSAGDQQ
ncbi:hypothetical protein BSL82_09405 [Tardibacter chloracetimidivorans]|uniref:Phosphohydrolase n=1 Tax=Tardibacter chloracetimidivorans TaxID=1921510 RepID=A0A1L3ZV18_9SPHN|nr:hypothetical protein [Tardibacter chloracetimidivorans]API59496.1 hypothetical protein BSL82_09405 [Tardibacter chloracetimidivorans]